MQLTSIGGRFLAAPLCHFELKLATPFQGLVAAFGRYAHKARHRHRDISPANIIERSPGWRRKKFVRFRHRSRSRNLQGPRTGCLSEPSLHVSEQYHGRACRPKIRHLVFSEVFVVTECSL